MSTGAGGPEGPPPQGGQQQGGWTPPPGAPPPAPPPQGAPPQGWGQPGAPPQGWGQQGAPPQGGPPQAWGPQGGPPQGWQAGPGPGPGGDPSEVVGQRIGAAIIDVIIMFVLFLVLGALFGGADADHDGASVALAGGEFLLYIVLWLAYYIGTEATWNATVGKRALGLVVRSADGSKPSVGQVAGRNLLRIVDSLPFLYLVGLITMLVTQRKQRVGDLAASTIVVKRQP